MKSERKKYQSYTFGVSVDLTENQLSTCVDLFNTPSGNAVSRLGGRGSMRMDDIEGIGPVAVKHYFRGGIIRYVNKHRYLKCGSTRGQIEYEMLKKVRDIGVNAPDPLMYAFKGHPFYKAWLITRKIEAHQTLADLSLKDIKHACMVMKNVIEQLSLLITNRILHVDLHPGNVVVDDDDNVYLVDFDKARMYQGSKQKLTHRYRSRWKRAVVKHNLPSVLYELMGSELKETI